MNKITKFIKNLGIVLGVPGVAVIVYIIHEQNINYLKSEIEREKSYTEILKEVQPDKIHAKIEAQKKIYQEEKNYINEHIEILNKEIDRLRNNSLNPANDTELEEFMEIITIQEQTIEGQNKAIKTLEKNIDSLLKVIGQL